MPSTPSLPPPPSASERFWRNTIFYLSAMMGALALVDFDAGRVAHGLGDAGVACLLVSIEAQFPLIRAMVKSGGRKQTTEQLLREAAQQRAEHPWPHRLGNLGWALMAASLILRWSGIG